MARTIGWVDTETKAKKVIPEQVEEPVPVRPEEPKAEEKPKTRKTNKK